jgi:hypothetical protein
MGDEAVFKAMAEKLSSHLGRSIPEKVLTRAIDLKRKADTKFQSMKMGKKMKVGPRGK